MKFRATRAASLGLLLVLSSLGCAAATEGHDDSVETSEQATTASDLALAKDVLALIGGPSGKCVGCHTATPTDVRAWGKSMQAVDGECQSSCRFLLIPYEVARDSAPSMVS